MSSFGSTGHARNQCYRMQTDANTTSQEAKGRGTSGTFVSGLAFALIKWICDLTFYRFSFKDRARLSSYR